MNKILYESRLLFCGWLLDIIIKVAPKQNDGMKLINAIKNYLESSIEEYERNNCVD